MADTKGPLYEGLFLMDQTALVGDATAGVNKVREILDRADAEVLTLSKWDERKLAYPVKGQKRGTYLLGLFHVDGSQIARIERDCNLSDEVLRVLITRGEHLGEVEIAEAIKQGEVSAAEAKLRAEAASSEEEAAEPVEAAAQPAEAASDESSDDADSSDKE